MLPFWLIDSHLFRRRPPGLGRRLVGRRVRSDGMEWDGMLQWISVRCAASRGSPRYGTFCAAARSSFYCSRFYYRVRRTDLTTNVRLLCVCVVRDEVPSILHSPFFLQDFSYLATRSVSSLQSIAQPCPASNRPDYIGHAMHASLVAA